MTGKAKAWSVAGALASAATIITLFGMVTRPAATYGKDTNRLAYCEAKALDNTNEIKRVEREARLCRDELAKEVVSMKQAQSRMEATLVMVQTTQAETRNDIKELLRRVR